MTVLFICQDGELPSGVATYGYSLLARFPSARMLLLNANQMPISVPREVVSQVEILPESVSHDPTRVAKALKKLASRMGADLTVFPNTGDTPWVAVERWLKGLRAVERSSVRVLGIVHSDIETQYDLAERYACIAPIWIGVSDRCAHILRERVGRLGVNVKKLPYPIAAPYVDRIMTSGPIRLAFVGRLDEPQKRVSRLVELFQKLLLRKCHFEATVAGDGPERERIQHAVRELGPEIGELVEFTGTVGREAVDAIWKSHDVCLLVSSYEGLPLTLLESMAAGVCPVVMRMESGIGELIKDGVEGVVVPQGDLEAMADSITELALNRKLLLERGLAACKCVREHFSAEAHFTELLKILVELGECLPPDLGLVLADPTAASVNRLVVEAALHGKEVAIYGAGMFGRKVIDACIGSGLIVRSWCDSDPTRCGLEYQGLVCGRPGDVVLADVQVFIASSLEFGSEMKDRIELEFESVGASRPVIVVARRF